MNTAVLQDINKIIAEEKYYPIASMRSFLVRDFHLKFVFEPRLGKEEEKKIKRKAKGKKILNGKKAMETETKWTK